MILGFVVLCFVLFAVCLGLAFLYVKRVFEDEMDKTERKYEERMLGIEGQLTGLENSSKAMVEAMNTYFKKDNVTAFSVPNYKQSMEDRAVEENAKFVMVNGEKVPVGKTGQ